MNVYGVVDSRLDEAVELFLRREGAERVVRDLPHGGHAARASDLDAVFSSLGRTGFPGRVTGLPAEADRPPAR